MKPVTVGILGCGAIFPAYLNNLRNHFSDRVTVIACADVMPHSAQQRAKEFGISLACTPEELLRDKSIELIVNLTPAPAHHASSLSILRADKHLFTEKPLALSRDHAREILQVASERGLQVGGAADTFLGGSLQLARSLIDEGAIGTPLAAQAIVALNMYHSERYHSIFRGALLDMGPYYVTALVALLGPIDAVSGFADIRFPTKVIAPSGPDSTKYFSVDIPTTVSAALAFSDGTVGTLVASCDVWSYFPRVEIHGTAGSMILNDANHYGGTVQLNRHRGSETLTPKAGFVDTGRGLGLAEMAEALRANKAPRASGALMFHVLDALLAVGDSSRTSHRCTLDSQVTRPESYGQVSPK